MMKSPFRLMMIFILSLSYSGIIYAQSISNQSLENVFFSANERLLVTFGNLNKYSETYKISVSKLYFSLNDVTNLTNNTDKENSEKKLSNFFNDVKPESTTKRKLNKILKLSAGKTRKVKVPVFNLEKNKLNFYRICSESEPKGGYVYEVCTHSVIYYSDPN
ncbi:hypothetical protein GTG28_14170 [Vibrio sp. OCN044]|uniref:Uncharacterized protein n=1 Tax=Vibrio tetraodonis subsp. pristinus TaxID=2695891 RepID=A0A6L8LZ43_9VIBR|nr:hypothetical protein [Vibrio tetraodonis]MYM60376.1 hypothetical protein [Vibrio tetraodonis subsp. pristinus]